MEPIIKVCHIECECGTHILKIQSEAQYYTEQVLGNTRFRQEYQFAMFYYGIGSSKENIWNRIKIAWKYLRSGKMFSDQILLTPIEAKKLSEFINDTIIQGETPLPVQNFRSMSDIDIERQNLLNELENICSEIGIVWDDDFLNYKNYSPKFDAADILLIQQFNLILGKLMMLNELFVTK